MERTVIKQLREWKTSNRRKPLIIRGARQVGKTWILKEFGKEFRDGFAYFNLDRNKEYAQFFEGSKDIKRLLTNLSIASRQTITTDTLIIFDEIQECPNALNSLKYFCEDAPDYYVASAGSLLGLQLTEGFPVGKVDFIEMGPMTFEEFVIASGDENYLQYIDSLDSISCLPDAIANPLEERLRQYFIVGGMPEAVSAWTEENNPIMVDQILSDIIYSYEGDFAKHVARVDSPKVKYIWDSLPSQLAKENKKFLYSSVKPGARAREYENALMWLVNADICHKIYRITRPGLPISAYDDLTAFKIYMNDVGLLRRHAHLATSAYAEGERLYTEFKGALTENYILQHLVRMYDVKPRYWADTTHEVDFVIQRGNDIFPVEVKAGGNVRSTSIKKYDSKFGEDTRIMIRFSMRNLSLDGRILNIPLYMVNYLDKFIDIALNKGDGPF